MEGLLNVTPDQFYFPRKFLFPHSVFLKKFPLIPTTNMFLTFKSTIYETHHEHVEITQYKPKATWLQSKNYRAKTLLRKTKHRDCSTWSRNCCSRFLLHYLLLLVLPPFLKVIIPRTHSLVTLNATREQPPAKTRY